MVYNSLGVLAYELGSRTVSGVRDVTAKYLSFKMVPIFLRTA